MLILLSLRLLLVPFFCLDTFLSLALHYTAISEFSVTHGGFAIRKLGISCVYYSCVLCNECFSDMLELLPLSYI